MFARLGEIKQRDDREDAGRPGQRDGPQVPRSPAQTCKAVGLAELQRVGGNKAGGNDHPPGFGGKIDDAMTCPVAQHAGGEEHGLIRETESAEEQGPDVPRIG